MTTCTHCGAQLAPGASVCTTCGTAVAAPVPNAGAPAFGGALNDWQSNVTRPSMSGATSVIGELKASGAGGRPVPQLAMALAGVSAAIAVLVLIRVVSSIKDISDLTGLFRLGGGFTLGLILLVAAGGLGVAALWVAIAWLARGGSSITVPLVYVVGAATAISGLTGGSAGTGFLGHSALTVVAALLALGAIGLTFVPEVRAYLYGGASPARPASLVASEALLYWFAVTGVLIGVGYLIVGLSLGDLSGRIGGNYYVAAIAYIAAAVAAAVFAAAVGRGAAQARLLVSVTAAAFVILTAIAGNLGGAWVHTVILVGVVALLWLTADARAAFGDTVLDLNKLQGPRASTPQAPQSETPTASPYESPVAPPPSGATGEPPLA